MSITEFRDSGTATKDRNGVIRATRHWKIDGNVDPAAILDDPQSVQDGTLPPYGQPHPMYPGAILDNYSVGDEGGVIASVVASYSNDARFRFKSSPDRFGSTDFNSWSGAISDEVIPIPYAVKTRTTVPDPAGGAAATVEGWAFRNLDALTTIRVNSRVFVIDAGDIERLLIQLDLQHNNLHKLNGVWYRFEAGNYTEQETGKWEVVYSWTHDPGHKSVQVATADSEIIAPGMQTVAIPAGFLPNFDGTGYLRWPFHQLLIYKDPTQGTGPSDPLKDPKFAQMLPYAIDADGWKYLPGLGIQ